MRGAGALDPIELALGQFAGGEVGGGVGGEVGAGGGVVVDSTKGRGRGISGGVVGWLECGDLGIGVGKRATRAEEKRKAAEWG